MRHCGLDLHRHLIPTNLQAYRTNGGMASRTRSVLQILHAPPSLPRVVVCATSYARTPAMSIEGPQHLVVRVRKNTISCVTIRICSNLVRSHGWARQGPFPPRFRRLSASSRQSFHRLLHRAVHRDSLGNPSVLHRICDDFS